MGQTVIQLPTPRSCIYCKVEGLYMLKTPSGKYRLHDEKGKIHSCNQYDPSIKATKKWSKRGVQP